MISYQVPALVYDAHWCHCCCCQVRSEEPPPALARTPATPAALIDSLPVMSVPPEATVGNYLASQTLLKTVGDEKIAFCRPIPELLLFSFPFPFSFFFFFFFLFLNPLFLRTPRSEGTNHAPIAAVSKYREHSKPACNRPCT